MRAQVPEDKAAVLDEFLKRNGCTLGAFWEAWADILVEVGGTVEGMTGKFPELIARAQDITAARRRRK